MGQRFAQREINVNFYLQLTSLKHIFLAPENQGIDLCPPEQNVTAFLDFTIFLGMAGEDEIYQRTGCIPKCKVDEEASFD